MLYNISLVRKSADESVVQSAPGINQPVDEKYENPGSHSTANEKDLNLTMLENLGKRS